MVSIPSDTERYLPYPSAPCYLIYEDGRVYSSLSNKFVKQRMSSGYPTVSLLGKMIRVHRLVAETFHQNLETKPMVDHKDGNKSNNCPENLRWVTAQENSNGSHKKDHNVIGVIRYRDEDSFCFGFKSVAEASRLTGTSADMISWCIRPGNETKDAAAGNGERYRWRYRNPPSKIEHPEDAIVYKPLPNYSVCPDGRIYSEKKKRILKPYIDADGYARISLYIGHKGKKVISKHFQVHRLVASIFLEVPENHEKMDVNHKDLNKTNNHYTNLEWLNKTEHARVTVLQTRRNCKKVYMRDSVTQEVLREFPSTAEAAKFVGKTSGFVANVCRGIRKTCGGYDFVYEDGLSGRIYQRRS